MRETNLLDGLKIVKDNIENITDRLLAEFYVLTQEELLKRKAFAVNQALVDPRNWARQKEEEERERYKKQKKK